MNERYDWWVIDAIYNQYLLSLGEFETLENFMLGPESRIIMTIFGFATFFTQITMLNMLIAIMGDEFDFQMEFRNMIALVTKLRFLTIHAPILRNKSKEV